MTIHKEGRRLLWTLFIGLTLLNFFVYYFISPPAWGLAASVIVCTVLYILILQFFRVPKRSLNASANDVVCPADGKVVVIEETDENEVLKTRCIQISIFMSPLNVHVQWYPISGEVSYYKYHPGKYLVAWHPKSSTENERSTVVVDSEDGKRILFRQIAGAVARRIICYSKKGEQAVQGSEFGFIKFGSRVDVFLPLGTDVKVKIGDKVKGIETILASLR